MTNSIRRSFTGALSFMLMAAEGPQTLTFTPMDPEYPVLLETEDSQINAKHTNLDRRTDYITKLSNYQLNVSAGRGDTMKAPTKPLMVTVSNPYYDDAGTLQPGAGSEGPFVPALPDPMRPKTNPSQVNTAPHVAQLAATLYAPSNDAYTLQMAVDDARKILAIAQAPPRCKEVGRIDLCFSYFCSRGCFRLSDFGRTLKR
jgi:hypothetical protein